MLARREAHTAPRAGPPREVPNEMVSCGHNSNHKTVSRTSIFHRMHLVIATSRRAIPLLPLSIGWREGWGERPRATLLPAGLPPLPIGWGEGRGEGPCFLRPVGLT